LKNTEGNIHISLARLGVVPESRMKRRQSHPKNAANCARKQKSALKEQEKTTSRAESQNEAQKNNEYSGKIKEVQEVKDVLINAAL
jgi:hypothetical protein